MFEKIKKHWTKILAFFVTIIIPLLAWVGGFLPQFVSAQDLKIYQEKIIQLDAKQTDLALEFKRAEREDVEQDQLRIEREIFKIEKERDEIPPFYIEQRLRYDQKIHRLDQDIDDLRSYKLKMNGNNNIIGVE